jgi:release factor glutamine methyltransferase
VSLPGGPATVAQALAEARSTGIERLDAQLLLAHVLQKPRAWLHAHDDAVLGADQVARFRSGLARRAAGEPLAYITGERAFHGLTLQVTPDVLVPRPETETLVDWALEWLATSGDAPAVVDLGTGSGAIALSLASACPPAQICAVDRSRAALAVAGANAQALRLHVEWLESDWWSALAGRRFDAIVSNPPYIAAADAHLAALRHEPLQALTPGGDGLSALRAVVAGAADHLSPHGWIVLEHGHDQADAVQVMLRRAGFRAVQTRTDLSGNPRCTGGRLGI